MSTTWEDAALDMAYAEEAWQETVNGIKEEALIEFGEERYEAFFIQNPEMHINTLEIVDESKSLLDNQHFSASVIYSFIVVENILRNLILRPLVWGTFIDEEAANLITDGILNNRLDQISKFIFHFIKGSINLDILTTTRPEQTTPLWQEINELKLLRNHIVHKGAKCDKYSAGLPPKKESSFDVRLELKIKGVNHGQEVTFSRAGHYQAA